MRFPAGQLPPVDGFWSLTAYDQDGYFIPNALNRQLLGGRDKLLADADGAIELLIQATPPSAEKTANWLPVGAGRFTLMLRLYWPRDPIINGSWAPPPVTRAD
jgi:hypothetical protein